MTRKSGSGKAIEVAIETKIQRLIAERGAQVPIAEVGQVVSSLMDALHGDQAPQDLRVYSELESLARYIYRAKQEISEIRPEDISNEHIPQASIELDAIGVHLENATGDILDAAEIIGTIAGELEGDSSERLNDAVTRIYEACNFQDLSGQRITKVIQTLQTIEVRIELLLKALGRRMHTARPPRSGPLADRRKGEDRLLNGPAAPGDTNSQKDIDALLAGFD